MVKRWEDDWMHSNFVPTHVALSRRFENDELRAMIQFHGTPQRHFYTVARFNDGARSDVVGQFSSLDEAKAAVRT